MRLITEDRPEYQQIARIGRGFRSYDAQRVYALIVTRDE